MSDATKLHGDRRIFEPKNEYSAHQIHALLMRAKALGWDLGEKSKLEALTVNDLRMLVEEAERGNPS